MAKQVTTQDVGAVLMRVLSSYAGKDNTPQVREEMERRMVQTLNGLLVGTPGVWDMYFDRRTPVSLNRKEAVWLYLRIREGNQNAIPALVNPQGQEVTTAKPKASIILELTPTDDCPQWLRDIVEELQGRGKQTGGS